MAFKTSPFTDWQTLKGVDRSMSPCEVCDSNFSNGLLPLDDSFVSLCNFHSSMTLRALNLVLKCKHEGIKISIETFEQSGWNSFDRDTMIPFMSNELLVQNTELTLKNCSPIRHNPAAVYDEALQLYAQELIKRLVPEGPKAKAESELTR